LELPQSKEIKDVTLDGLLINMFLCLLVVAGVVLGIKFNIIGIYAAGALYVL